MKSKLYSLIACTLLSLGAKAEVVIYFFTGKVEIAEPGKNARLLVKVNEQLPGSATLKLYENAEVILRDEASQFCVLKKPTDYSPAKIKEAFNEQKGKNLIESVAGFLGTQFTNKKEDIRAMSESYMRQKGGVTRSGNVFPLMVWPVYGSVYDTNSITFIWNSLPGVKKYEFVIYGGEDPNNLVQLGKSTETDTFMHVDFKDFGTTTDAYFSWVAYPDGDPNYTRHSFKIAGNETLKNMIQDADRAAAKEKTAETKWLVKALSFEKDGLVKYADNAYKKVLEINNSTVNQQLYQLFKIRNNVDKTY